VTYAALENPLPRKELVILYVEDQPQTYMEMFSLIQEFCSEQSRHARSLETARRHVESSDFRPHFVILDRQILYYDREGTVPDELAGDMLYEFLLSCEIPVLLMTTKEASVLELENPYRSDPPVLGYMPKLSNELTLRKAVSCYLQYREDRS
jgi:hypothetical protein